MVTAKKHAAALALALLTPAAALAQTVPDETAFAVTALLAGASAEDMARRATAIMESHLGAARGLAFMVSVSSAGTSRVILKFGPSVGEDAAARAVDEQIARLRGRLPEDIGAPIVSRMSMAAQPVAYIAFSTERYAPAEVTEMLAPFERALLQSSDAFESLVRLGAHYPFVGLRLDLVRLAANGITVQKVRAALALEGIESEPVSRVPGEFALRLTRDSRPAEPEEVANTRIRNGLGDDVRLRELGVVMRDALSDGTIARFDGKSVVLIEVHPRNGISAVEATRAVHRGVRALAIRLPGGVSHRTGYSCGACAALAAEEEHR